MGLRQESPGNSTVSSEATLWAALLILRGHEPPFDPDRVGSELEAVMKDCENYPVPSDIETIAHTPPTPCDQPATGYINSETH